MGDSSQVHGCLGAHSCTPCTDNCRVGESTQKDDTNEIFDVGARPRSAQLCEDGVESTLAALVAVTGASEVVPATAKPVQQPLRLRTADSHQQQLEPSRRIRFIRSTFFLLGRFSFLFCSSVYLLQKVMTSCSPDRLPSICVRQRLHHTLSESGECFEKEYKSPSLQTRLGLVRKRNYR